MQGEGSTGTLEPVVPFSMVRAALVTQIHMGSERDPAPHTPRTRLSTRLALAKGSRVPGGHLLGTPGEALRGRTKQQLYSLSC